MCITNHSKFKFFFLFTCMLLIDNASTKPFSSYKTAFCHHKVPSEKFILQKSKIENLFILSLSNIKLKSLEIKSKKNHNEASFLFSSDDFDEEEECYDLCSDPFENVANSSDSFQKMDSS